jgi:uncharacterized protein (DUF927 family)
VRYRGADEGDEQLAGGFHPAGTLEEWLKAIEPLSDYPRVRLGLYVSLSAALLSVLGTPNYVFSYAGDSSKGKTTALRIAASCWGNPDETSPRRIVVSWDGTQVIRERAPAVFNNMPVFFDDTKRIKGKEEVARTIYDFSQGQGRGHAHLARRALAAVREAPVGAEATGA